MCAEIVIRIDKNFVENYAENWWIDYCRVVWLICKFPGLKSGFWFWFWIWFMVCFPVFRFTFDLEFRVDFSSEMWWVYTSMELFLVYICEELIIATFFRLAIQKHLQTFRMHWILWCTDVRELFWLSVYYLVCFVFSATYHCFGFIMRYFIVVMSLICFVVCTD